MLPHGPSAHPGTTAFRRFAQQPIDIRQGRTRTAGQLRRQAREKKERERRRQAEEAEARRIGELEALAQRQPEAWAEVETLIGQRQAKAYDEAVDLLVRLRDLTRYQGEETSFQQHLDRICEQYSRRPALLRRLRDAGLADR
jgi:hypothetical protein